MPRKKFLIKKTFFYIKHTINSNMLSNSDILTKIILAKFKLLAPVLFVGINLSIIVNNN